MSSLQQVLQAVVGAGYQVERELPGGGMSRVFLAREPALARDVVIKVLPPDLLSSSSLQLFTREVQVTARLQHPYILPVITAGGTDDLRYYVTPFIRGESLRKRLASGDPLGLGDVIRLGDQLLQAVAFAHARGVIHRDVKPANILLSDGHAILADFGVAALITGHGPADSVTATTLDSGRAYVAPEDPREESRDLFAVAVVIHEMATGTHGAAGDSPAGISAALRARHPRASARETRRLAAVLSRALSVDPAARYQSAAEFRGAIHSVGGAPRRQVLAGIGLGGVAATLALGMLALGGQPSDRDAGADSPVLQGETSPTPPASSQLAVAADRASPVVVSPPMGALDSATMLYHRGDLSAAAALYAIAAREDSASARAYLGIAVTAGMNNTPGDAETSRAAAERALRLGEGLDGHDRAIAAGYVALAERRFPEACSAFERAREARETFDALFGAAECRYRDDAVLIDSGGTAHFRSGYHRAFEAYARAIRVARQAPSIAYRRLTMVLPQHSGDVRLGRSADNRVFVGAWRVLGDTLGFALSQSGPMRSVSLEAVQLAAEAARAGRERLRPIMVSWVRNSPADPAARELFALLLENSGVVAENGDDRTSALREIAVARGLETNPGPALRLASAHARLLIRARQFDELAALADSLFEAHPDPQGSQLDYLMPLALFTGRMNQATGMLAQLSGTSNRAIRGADARPVEMPPAVLAERADFLVRATLGVCDARVRSAPRRMRELLDAAFPAGPPRGVEAAFSERIIVPALPCVGPTVTSTLREPGRLLVSWVRAFDSTDAAFRAEFQARASNRPLSAGPEAAMDGIMVEVLARLAMSDSVGALKTLTLGLDRVPFLTRGVFTSEWTMGATARGMALAAELAHALEDRDTAQRWASAVVALWNRADPELQPQVTRLRSIVRVTADDPPRE